MRIFTKAEKESVKLVITGNLKVGRCSQEMKAVVIRPSKLSPSDLRHLIRILEQYGQSR